MLITDTLEKWASVKGNEIAIHTTKNQLTFRHLKLRVDELSCYFHVIKKKKSMNKVAFLLPNSIEFLPLFLGAVKAGWVSVPFDYKWTRKEIKERVDQCDPNLIITDASFYPKVKGLDAKIVLLTEINHHLSELESHVPTFNVNEEAPFYMGFTSGSTGSPKCFIRSHKSWVKSFDCSSMEFGLSDQEAVLVPGPLVHSLFLYAAISTLFLGGTTYLLDKFSASETFDLINQSNLTTMYVVPTMFASLVKDERVPVITNNLKRLISSGSKWEKGLKRKVRNLFPESELIEFYGASELSFVSFLDNQGNEKRPGSVGKPFHNVEISIRKDDREVEVGEIGLLYVKSEMIFIEYYQNPLETNRILNNGWATVGDLAKLDEDGYLTIIGRENNMIITGGLNVYPEEVESVLNQMKEVEEVAVIGIPDDHWGEKLVAIVKLKKDQILKKQVMTAYCRGQLANYKIPRTFLIVDSFPYTTSGKIARADLKESLIQEVQLK
jgi:long-chain acyl-CoA synthetase